MDGRESIKDFGHKVEKILLEEIDLAKPDDLAFLEFQVQRIAGRIALAIYNDQEE